MTRRGWALFGALSVIWGVPYLFIRVAVEYVSPSVLVCLRTGLAAAVLLPLAVRGRMLRPVLARWRWVLAFAVLEIIVPFGMLGRAEQRLTSSLTGLLVAGVPLLGAVLGVALRLPDRIRPGNPTDRGRVLGLVVGLAGVAAIVGIDVRGGDLLAAGEVGVAALGYAIGPVLAEHRLAGLPALGVSTVASAIAALAYLPATVVQWPAAGVPWRAWGSVAVLGVLCSAIAFVLFFALVAEVGPSRTTLITYVNPVVAGLLGVAFLAEPVTSGLVAGFPLVLLGSWLATRRAPAPALAPGPEPAPVPGPETASVTGPASEPASVSEPRVDRL